MWQCFNQSVAHHVVDNTHTHTRLMALCPGLPRWAGTRKVKPIWILLEQETVSGSGISWAICKSAPCSIQITMPTPHHSVFTGRIPFLPPNQQRQSTEGMWIFSWSLWQKISSKTRWQKSHPGVASVWTWRQDGVKLDARTKQKHQVNVKIRYFIIPASNKNSDMEKSNDRSQ